MVKVLRMVGSIIAGLAAAFVVIIALEYFGSVVHPFPADFDGSMEQMCRHVERFPAWVLAVVVPAWAFAAMAGAWITGRFANRGCALVTGLLLLAALGLNLAMLPYPAWFKIANVVAMPLAIAAGLYLSNRGRGRSKTRTV